jgi:hydroxypyruvate isomerase
VTEETLAKRESWHFDYASHLGYLPPEFTPQFVNSAGSADLEAQVAFAAQIGMSGVLYPWASVRPPEEVLAVGRAISDNGLKCSCILATPVLNEPEGTWTDRSSSGRKRLEQYVVEASETARSLTSSSLVVLPIGKPESGEEDRERAAFTENLAEMAVVASEFGLTIDLEPMNVLPGILINELDQALEVVEEVGHPAAGIVFDTGHVSQMRGDLVELLDRSFDRIHLLQFADEPARVEPGAGVLPIVDIAVEARRRGYEGLVDLEFHFQGEDHAGEIEGLGRLHELDRRATEILSAD